VQLDTVIQNTKGGDGKITLKVDICTVAYVTRRLIAMIGSVARWYVYSTGNVLAWTVHFIELDQSLETPSEKHGTPTTQ
jgi:hypothetical protein